MAIRCSLLKNLILFDSIRVPYALLDVFCADIQNPTNKFHRIFPIFRKAKKNPIKEQIFDQAFLFLKVNTNIPTLPKGKVSSTMAVMSQGISQSYLYDKTCMFSFAASSYNSY